MEAAIHGIADACNVLSTPVISGNVSLYNETSGGAVYPTPVIGMLGIRKTSRSTAGWALATPATRSSSSARTSSSRWNRSGASTFARSTVSSAAG